MYICSVQANPTTAPATIVRTLKSVSAVAVFHAFPRLKRQCFLGSGLWSRGAYYGTVGHISEDVVRRYIETQKMRAFRRTRAFLRQDEPGGFLRARSTGAFPPAPTTGQG